jgi:release factor glutamine methyltransferase
MREQATASVHAEACITTGMTIAAARRAVTDAFRGAGLDTPDLDARLLVGRVVALDHAGLVAAAGRPLTRDEAAALTALARRRLAREPVARIVGMKEFWGLPIRLGPATLVPRPETETVVEAALAALDATGERTRPLRIADLGTGSGALMLALLSEFPNASAIGTDVSVAALAVAAGNAERLGFAGRAQFVACDFGAVLAGAFDLVVSNPPYIATADLAALDAEVRDHDPLRALDGGADGLAGYGAIARDAGRLLGAHGHLVVELGVGAGGPVAALFSAAGLRVAAPRCDLAGVPRALHIYPAESG